MINKSEQGTNTITCIFTAGISESARIVLLTLLMGWNFEDHFEDSKGPGPQGHDAIARFFGLKTQPLHNIPGRNATSNLYIHIHTQIQRWWRATSSVLKERGHACAVATHLCSSRAPQMQNLNRYVKRDKTPQNNSVRVHL